MQYAVPQFTDVEDKLIGPLTLKQFFVVLAAGGICLLVWTLVASKALAIFIDIPIALAGIGLAFANYNSRPMISYILPFISYMLSPKVMIFRREAVSVNVTSIPKEIPEEKIEKIAEEPAAGRLKKLAYLLDQKTAEQNELLGKTGDIKTQPKTDGQR